MVLLRHLIDDCVQHLLHGARGEMDMERLTLPALACCACEQLKPAGGEALRRVVAAPCAMVVNCQSRRCAIRKVLGSKRRLARVCLPHCLCQRRQSFSGAAFFCPFFCTFFCFSRFFSRFFCTFTVFFCFFSFFFA